METEQINRWPKITVILLNYNNYKDTFNCIDSLRQVEYPNFEVLVVDNKSTNDSFKKLKSLESSVIRILDSGKNGGFAYGNNVGIYWALKNRSDYILLLNNDTLVTPNFLFGLLEGFECRDNVGIATCRIMYNSDRNKVWYAGGEIDWSNLRATHIGIDGSTYQNHGIREVSFASGCCMLISRDCIEKSGRLPEEYFMYYEDLDYCVNVSKHGYKLAYNPNAVIYHCVSGSGGGSNSPFVIEWSNRARRKFYRKYKNEIFFLKRGLTILKCELRTLMKIIFNTKRYPSLMAYFKSFRKVN